MPSIRGRIKLLKFDKQNFTKTLKKQIEIQFREAARAFVRAAAPAIPMITGMARGSFLDIAKALRVDIGLNPPGYRTRIRQTKSGTKKYKVVDKWYYPPGGGGRIPKTPESGAALSTRPPTTPIGSDRGALLFWDSNNLLKFHFQSKVFHYTLEDQIGSRSPTAPWQSIQKGKAAFQTEMLKLRTRLPRLGDFVLYTEITFGPNGVHLNETPIRLRQQVKVKESK